MKLLKLISEIKKIPYLFKAKVVNADLNRIKIYFDNSVIYGEAYPDIKQVQIYTRSYAERDYDFEDFMILLKDKKIPHDLNTTDFMENVITIDIIYFNIEGIEKLQ